MCARSFLFFFYSGVWGVSIDCNVCVSVYRIRVLPSCVCYAGTTPSLQLCPSSLPPFLLQEVKSISKEELGKVRCLTGFFTTACDLHGAGGKGNTKKGLGPPCSRNMSLFLALYGRKNVKRVFLQKLARGVVTELILYVRLSMPTTYDL